MITVVGSSSDMYNYAANSNITTMVNNYCANSMNNFLTYNAVNPYQQGTAIYNLVEKAKADAISGINHSYTPEVVIAKTQDMLNSMALYDRDALNQIHQIDFTSDADIQAIGVTPQQYIMADPTLAEAYDKGMIDGYSTTYKLDPYQKALPYENRYSYVDIHNHMVNYDEDGEAYTDESIVAIASAEDYSPKRLELTASDQFAISETIAAIRRARLRGVDLTKQN